MIHIIKQVLVEIQSFSTDSVHQYELTLWTPKRLAVVVLCLYPRLKLFCEKKNIYILSNSSLGFSSGEKIYVEP